MCDNRQGGIGCKILSTCIYDIFYNKIYQFTTVQTRQQASACYFVMQILIHYDTRHQEGYCPLDQICTHSNKFTKL